MEVLFFQMEILFFRRQLIIAFILALIFGNYLYKIASCKKTIFDFIFNPIDNLIYKICAIDRRNMTWQKLFFAFNCF